MHLDSLDPHQSFTWLMLKDYVERERDGKKKMLRYSDKYVGALGKKVCPRFSFHLGLGMVYRYTQPKTQLFVHPCSPVCVCFQE